MILFNIDINNHKGLMSEFKHPTQEEIDNDNQEFIKARRKQREKIRQREATKERAEQIEVTKKIMNNIFNQAKSLRENGSKDDIFLNGKQITIVIADYQEGENASIMFHEDNKLSSQLTLSNQQSEDDQSLVADYKDFKNNGKWMSNLKPDQAVDIIDILKEIEKNLSLALAKIPTELKATA